MLRKYAKMLTIIIIFLSIITAMYSVFADDDSYKVVPNQYKINSSNINSKTPEIATKIFVVMQYIGVGLAIAFTLIIGIKYIAGSVEDRAKYKEVVIPYIIGIVLIIGIPTLLKYLSNAIMN